MAEILPIKNEEEKSTGLFYFSILMFAVSVLAFLGFLFLEKKVQKEINDLEKKLSTEKPREIVDLEKKLNTLEKKINIFEILLQNHSFTSKIFDFIEKKTHPRVFVQKFGFELEKSLITLEGKTDNFYTLGQQMLALENENKILNLTLEGVQIGKDQKVEFTLKFNFDKEVIKPTIKNLNNIESQIESQNENI